MIDWELLYAMRLLRDTACLIKETFIRAKWDRLGRMLGLRFRGGGSLANTPKRRSDDHTENRVNNAEKATCMNSSKVVYNIVSDSFTAALLTRK